MNISKDRFDLQKVSNILYYPRTILNLQILNANRSSCIILNAIQEIIHSDKSFIEFHAFRSFYFRESLDHNYADLTNDAVFN